MRKREIARHEQFLLFPQCFQKVCFPGASKGVVWEWVKESKVLSGDININSLPNDKSLDWSKLKAFALIMGRIENIVGKGENFLFPQCFQKPYLSGSLKAGIVWKSVNPSLHT